MKVGVIADTHKKVGRAKKGVDYLLNLGAEYIIHAGDIVKTEVLDYLEELDITYLAVYGNNDSHLFQYHDQYNLVQEPYYFKIRDTSFKLMHHPYFMTPDVDVVIYGHTHIFHSQISNGTLFLNPGEICARDFPVSKVTLLDIEPELFSVQSFERTLKTAEWQTKTFTYSRIGTKGLTK
jgi:putative phosphoesterase